MTHLEFDRIPERAQLIALYSSVGWSVYTAEPDRLVLAVRQSLRVATAWDGDTLVGLARVVGDGVSIIYLQDVLVHPDHARSGLGTRLVRAAAAPIVRPVPQPDRSRRLTRGGLDTAGGTSSRG